MKIDRDPTVTSDHKGHHLKNAKGEIVKSFSRDAEGLRRATHAKYRLFKNLDLPPMEKEDMKEELKKTTSVGGTSLQGDIDASYEDLLKAIGIPHWRDEDNPGMSDGKIDVEWMFELPNGKTVTLYNWKNGVAYLGDEGLEVEDIKNWHIGAENKEDADTFKNYIMKQIVRKEDNTMSDLEKKLEEALNETITVNTTSDNNPDSQDSVTITANGEDAAELLGMLKMAGINQTAEEQPEMSDPTMADMIQIIPLDDAEEEVEEDLANAPHDASEVEGDVDTMVNAISGGLNKKKNAYAKAQDGDNAMAVKEDEEDLTETYLREFDEFNVEKTEDGVKVEKVGDFSVTIGADHSESEFSDEEQAKAAELFDLELEQAELDDENYVDEDALDENAFNMAAAQAAVDGKKEFEFGGEMHKVTMDKETAQKLIDESVMEDDVEEGLRIVKHPRKPKIDDETNEDEEDALDKEMSEEIEKDEEVFAEDEEDVNEGLELDSFKKLAGI